MKATLRSLLPCLGLAATFLLFASIGPSAFHCAFNLKTILTQSVIVGIGALGMTLVIVGGGIDLSVGSIIALATVLAAKVLGLGFLPGAVLPWAAAACAVAAGAGCGLLNGFLTARLGIIAFIVTLGTMQIYRGAAKWAAGEQTVTAPASWLNALMEVDPTPAWLVLAPGAWILLALAGAVSLVLTRTVFGRHVFALGSNEATARLCGIPVVRRRLLIYALGGAFAGMAGVMQFANLTLGDPTAAEGMELDIIAAVVIGGGSLRGGEGTAVGSLVGALLMAVLRNGCNMAGIPNYLQNIVVGAIIIGAMGLDKWRQRAAET
ncbi:MAG TPA: ABC transporter permease [Fibrobacteria bacterium]|nr:ABC transporter permease [Fibrobacteria bacterium]